MRQTIHQRSNLRVMFDEGDWHCSLIERARIKAEVSRESNDWINYVDICHSLRGLSIDDCAELRQRYKSGQSFSMKLRLKLCNIILTSRFPSHITPSERMALSEGLLGGKYPSIISATRDILDSGYLGSSLAHYPALLADSMGHPSNGMRFNRKRKVHRRMAMKLNESIVSQPDDLCQFLTHSDRRRCDQLASVAVVGNSPDLLGQGKGEEIDSHDLVVRFNKISAETAQEKHTGKRTDIWVKSPSTPIEHCPPDAKMVMVSGLHALTRPSFYWRKLATIGKPLGEFEATVWYELVQRFNAPPSAGTLAIAALQNNRPNLRIQHFGFTLTHGVHGSLPNHHNDQAQVSSRHNWQAEVNWLRKSAS